jgi:hypothetical protein
MHVSDEYAEYLNNQMKLKNNSFHFLWKVKEASELAGKKESLTVDGFPEKFQFDPKLFGKEMAERIRGLGIRMYENVLEKEKTPEDSEASP